MKNKLNTAKDSLKKFLDYLKNSLFSKEFKGNLIAYIYSIIFGIVGTILTFSITKSPVDTDEIKKEFLSIIKDEIDAKRNEVIEEESVFVFESGINQIKTIILLSSLNNEDEGCTKKIISIFEPKSESILDKIVGRPGFYELKSMTELPCFYSIHEKELIDVDNDGLFEVHLKLKASFADRSSYGPLFFKLNGKEWHLMTIPSLAEVINQRNKGIGPIEKLGNQGEEKAFSIFSKDENKEGKAMVDSLKQSPNFYNEDWKILHNDTENYFESYSNGGNYKIMKHPIKNYYHIGVLSMFRDGEAVLSDHYGVVLFFRFDKDKIIEDELWNWGYPIYSGYPLDLELFSFEEMQEAGKTSHMINGKFYGYFEFERIN